MNRTFRLLISEVKNELLKTKPLLARIDGEFLVEASITEMIEHLIKTKKLLEDAKNCQCRDKPPQCENESYME